MFSSASLRLTVSSPAYSDQRPAGGSVEVPERPETSRSHISSVSLAPGNRAAMPTTAMSWCSGRELADAVVPGAGAPGTVGRGAAEPPLTTWRVRAAMVGNS